MLKSNYFDYKKKGIGVKRWNAWKDLTICQCVFIFEEDGCTELHSSAFYSFLEKTCLHIRFHLGIGITPL